jgi:hypothetical protein
MFRMSFSLVLALALLSACNGQLASIVSPGEAVLGLNNNKVTVWNERAGTVVDVFDGQTLIEGNIRQGNPKSFTPVMFCSVSSGSVNRTYTARVTETATSRQVTEDYHFYASCSYPQQYVWHVYSYNLR